MNVKKENEFITEIYFENHIIKIIEPNSLLHLSTYIVTKNAMPPVSELTWKKCELAPSLKQNFYNSLVYSSPLNRNIAFI